MCRRNIRNAILILAVISVLLPGPDLSNAYARPCAGEIEVRSGEGDHSVEAPGIIVIQEVSEGMEEPEGKEEKERAMPCRTVHRKNWGNPAACLKSPVIAAVNYVPGTTN